MINIVLKAVSKCGHLQTKHHKCGMAAGVLTRAFAGLAAGASGVIAKCPNQLNGGKPLITYAGPSGALANTGIAPASSLGSAVSQAPGVFAGGSVTAGLGQCVVNIKDSMKSLFKALKRVITLRDDCKEGERACAHQSMKLVAGIAAIGEYIAGAIGKCTTSVPMATSSQCAQESLELGQHLMNVGRASSELNKHCSAESARLYQLEGVDFDTDSASNYVTLGLAAFLPLTGVFAFVAGSRFAKSQRRDSFSELNTAEI